MPDVQHWTGRPVLSSDGERIGTVTATGDDSVTVRIGRFSRTTARFSIDDLEVEDGHLRLPWDRAELRDGPPAQRPSTPAEPVDERRSERETKRAKEIHKGAADEGPDTPLDLPATTKKATIKRTISEFQADNGTDWAAALTYYGVLALFPGLIAMVSILGLIGDSATDPILDEVRELSPGPARDILGDALTGIASSQGAAGFSFAIGLLLALNAASGYVGAFTRASNEIYEVEEGRPIYKLKPAQIGITLVLMLLLLVVIAGVAVTGPLAEEIGKVFGAGDSFQVVFDIAKIPVLLAVVSFLFAFLYWAAPNVKQPGFRFVSPGGILALVVWIVASVAFSIYVANFGSYNKTYGALGGVVAFLVWLWITNIAVLLGAQFNAELQRSQQIAAGHRGDLDEPFLEPRDTSKLEG